MASNTYVPSPIGADYENANTEVIKRGVGFAKQSHRLLSGFGKNSNRFDNSASAFKYLEARLLSTKNVMFSIDDPTMLDNDFVKHVKTKDGVEYNMLRFNRKHNIRTFDFIITYSQLAQFTSDTFKSIPTTRQFRGSLLFTGCSVIRDTTTMEELPLKLYATYESIGDTVGKNVDIDAKTDTKGGPALTFNYTYDSEYVYVYIASVSPFRLIPIGDGRFQDVSYLMDEGLMVGEIKSNVRVDKIPEENIKKNIAFKRNSDIFCDITMQIRDTTISHSDGDIECVEYDFDLDNVAYLQKTSTLVVTPTNDGAMSVVGMAPSSFINFEAAPDMAPIRFGSRLLTQDTEKVVNMIDRLKEQIKAYAVNCGTVPFVIKTMIRTVGKYNIKGDYFVDSQADSFGQILIEDVGTYDATKDEFDITEYVFDNKRLQVIKADTVKQFKEYTENASDYLAEVTLDKNAVKHVNKEKDVLRIIKNIQFEDPNNLEVYYNVAFIRPTVSLNVVACYAELGDDNTTNEDDRVIYICKDGKIKISSFKDYSMDEAITYDPFSEVSSKILSGLEVKSFTRAWVEDHYVYVYGTNNGLLVFAEGLLNSNNAPDIYVINAFRNDEHEQKALYKEQGISYISTDDEYVFVGGDDGATQIIDLKSFKSIVPRLYFRADDPIKYATRIDNNTVLFVSHFGSCTFNMTSGKWNDLSDPYHMSATFDNPFEQLSNPNKDLIISENGCEGVPVIQVGSFLYALGLRTNDSGTFEPCYTKLNLENGERTQLPVPSYKFRTTGAKICKSGTNVYLIGGTCPYEPLSSKPDELFTKIVRFDTVSETFTLEENAIITTGSDPVSCRREFQEFYPTIVDDKYIVFYGARAKYYTQESQAGFTVHYEKEKLIHTYNIETKSNDSFLLSNKLESGVVANTKFDVLIEENNAVPARVKDNEVVFLMSERVLEVNEQDKYEFHGFNIYRITVKLNDGTVSDVSVSVEERAGSTEFFQEYTGAMAQSSPKDIFATKSFALVSEYNEAIIYCMNKVMIYLMLDPIKNPYTGKDVNYSEFHLIYHSVGGGYYKPLMSYGEYAAWQNYEKTPANTILAHVGNYVVFIGGTAGRTYGYLALDTISLIPAARYYNRVKDENESSVLKKELSSAISLIAGKDLKIIESSTCKIGNTVYLLAVTEKKNIFMFKYDVFKTASEITFVEDLTDKLVSTKYKSFRDFTIVACGKKIFITPYTVAADDEGTLSYSITERNILELWIFNPEDRSVKLVCDDAVFDNGDYIFTISSNSCVTYASNNGNIINVSNNGVIVRSSISIDQRLNRVDEMGMIKEIIPSVYSGNNSCCAIPFKSEIVLFSFDSEGQYSVPKTVESVPRSQGYYSPCLYLDGNDLYLSKGYRENRDYDTQIIRYYALSIFGVYESTALFVPQVTLLPTGVSYRNAPFAFGRNGNCVVFGNNEISGNTKFEKQIFTVKSNSFVPVRTEIVLEKREKTDNWFNPVMSSFMIEGVEILLVFSGKKSPQSLPSTSIDAYDTSRHIWKNIGEIPYTLERITVQENDIIGGTKIDINTGAREACVEPIKITCTDYSSFSFKIETGSKAINDVLPSTFVKVARNGNTTFVIPVNEYDNLVDSNIYMRDEDSSSQVTPINEKAEAIYNPNVIVVGCACKGRVLLVLLFNKATSTFYLWKNNGINWVFISEFTDTTFDPNNAYAFKTSKEAKFEYIAGVRKEIVGTLVYKNGVVVGVINILRSDTNNVEVDTYELYKARDIEIVDVSKLKDVDGIDYSKDKFVYLASSSDLEAGPEIFRIFPDNYTMYGIGVQALKGTDDKESQLITRCSFGNFVYSLYEDKTISKIDLTGKTEKESLGTVSIEDDVTTIISSWANKNGVYFFIRASTETAEACKIKIYTYNPESKETTSFEYEGTYKPNSKGIPIVFDDNWCVPLDVADLTDPNSEQMFNVGYVDGRIEKVPFVYDVKNKHVLLISDGKKSSFAAYDGNVIKLYEYNDDKVTLVDKNDIGEGFRFYVYKNGKIYAEKFGKVYEIVLCNNRIVSKGYSYNTVFEEVFTKNVVFRNNDICKLELGIRYLDPHAADTTHYCFNNTELNANCSKEYQNDIVSIGLGDGGVYYIRTFDKETFKLKSNVRVRDPDNRDVLTIDGFYGLENDRKIVTKVGNDLHFLVFGKSGVTDINASNGAMRVCVDKDFRTRPCVTIVPSNSTKFIIRDADELENVLYVYNASDNTVTERKINCETGKVDSILFVDVGYPNFGNIYTICRENDSDEFCFVSFNSANLDVYNKRKINICSKSFEVYESFDDEITAIVDGTKYKRIVLNEDKSNVVCISECEDYIEENITCRDTVLLSPKVFKPVGASLAAKEFDFFDNFKLSIVSEDNVYLEDKFSGDKIQLISTGIESGPKPDPDWNSELDPDDDMGVDDPKVFDWFEGTDVIKSLETTELGDIGKTEIGQDQTVNQDKVKVVTYVAGEKAYEILLYGLSLDSFEKWSSTDETQAGEKHNWFALKFAFEENPANTIKYNDNLLTETDVEPDGKSVILWVKLDELKDTPKVVTFGKGDEDKETYTIKFIEGSPEEKPKEEEPEIATVSNYLTTFAINVSEVDDEVKRLLNKILSGENVIVHPLRTSAYHHTISTPHYSYFGLIYIFETDNGKASVLTLKVDGDVEFFDKTIENAKLVVSSSRQTKDVNRILKTKGNSIVEMNQYTGEIRRYVNAYESTNPNTIGDLSASGKSIVFVVGDYTYVKRENLVFVFAVGVNGALKPVNEGYNSVALTLTDSEDKMLSLIAPGSYYALNDRKCVTGGELDIYMNTIDAQSELYNKFIGVTADGRAYDIATSLTDFEISTIDQSDEVSNNLKTRSLNNIAIDIYFIRKALGRNIVGKILAMSRFDTSSFEKNFETTSVSETGEIYAFTSNEQNGVLTRDDSAYYLDRASVAIINYNMIKIFVDGAWHTYSTNEGNNPFTNNLYPTVLAYGSRINAAGEKEARYYSFIDVRGNMSTFDRELKTFVDILGNVDVEVPFFSTEALIFPSTVTEKGSQGYEIWAISDNTPYQTDQTGTTDQVALENSFLVE